MTSGPSAWLPWALNGAALLGLLALCWGWFCERRRSRRLGAHLDLAQTHIQSLRGHDPLTGLITRAQFEQALDAAVATCDRHGGKLAVLHFGLDNFRPINEGYGHQVGDALLAQVARRLQDAVKDIPGPPAAVSRLAGDEFALLLQADAVAAGQRATLLLQRLQQPFTMHSLSLHVTTSVGIAMYPDHGSRSRLLGHAAMAMRSVKLGGGGAHGQYDKSLDVNWREQAELLQELRQALARGQLQLFYQPKVDARSLQVTAAEALLRWQHPQRGMISPVLFVPLAERAGLIVEIGRWVIEEACRQAAAWRKQGLRMRVAVNLSGHQLRQDDLVQHIEATLHRHGIPPGRLTCEITESVAMEDTSVTRAAFEQLRRAGLHVSVDDFGTGHSSLAALRRLPAAELKIDRAFVADLADGGDPLGAARAYKLVQAIVQMAHSLGLRVVAEGVETEGQRDLLVALGCDEMQGYLFARPMSADVLALRAHSGRASAPGRAGLTAPGTAADATGAGVTGAGASGATDPQGDEALFSPSLFLPTAPAPLDS
jgi:diguanylate cyclase